VIQASLGLIDRARTGALIELRHKLSAADFDLLINDNDWSPVKYFVVGAVIWWALTVERVYDMGEDSVPLLYTNAEERRARLSLPFLESAAASGYDDAFLEMYKAHALLATKLKLRVGGLNR